MLDENALFRPPATFETLPAWMQPFQIFLTIVASLAGAAAYAFLVTFLVAPDVVPGEAYVEKLLILVAAFVLLIAYVFAARRWSIWYGNELQRCRDHNANLVASPDAYPEVPFFLYLRPFVSTNEVAVSAIQQVLSVVQLIILQNVPILGSRAYERASLGRNEFENRLCIGTLRFGILVALGKPGEHFGAGRIETSDTNWQQAVTDLMFRAQYIFLVPHENAGTAWEVEQILSDPLIIEKTIIVDTPSLSRLSYKQFNVDKSWPLLQAQFKRRGFDLPKHKRDGAFYAFRSDGALRMIAKFKQQDRGFQIEKIIRELTQMRKYRPTGVCSI